MGQIKESINTAEVVNMEKITHEAIFTQLEEALVDDDPTDTPLQLGAVFLRELLPPGMGLRITIVTPIRTVLHRLPFPPTTLEIVDVSTDSSERPYFGFEVG